MAIEKTIKINVDASDATKGLDSVNEGLKDVNKTAGKAGDGIEGTSKSVKGLGVAFKAIGIGLIVALVAKLTEVFAKNQKVVDFVSTAMETLNIAFNDFFNFIFDNAGGVTSFFKDIFENPLESIKKLGTLIKENLIERFESLLDVAGFLSDAFVKLFKGDFAGALESMKDAGKESIDVFTGVNNTVDTVVDGVSTLIEKGGEYLSQTLKQAKANVELANTAELAAAQQARLVEQYDRLAEKQRQIRDDESISIKERQEANEKLATILEQQEKAMLRQADLQVAAAAAQVRTNNNIENQVALTNALAEREGVLATVEGFRSEQLVNRIALKKEEIELNNSISDAEKERRLAQLEFEETQELNAVLRLEKQRERLDEENEIIADDLERKKELYAEGTQARVDAEQEFLTRQQEIANEIDLNDKQLSDEKFKRDELVAQASVDLAQNTLGLIGSIAKEGSAVAKGVQVAQATISGIEGVQKAYTTAQGSPITALFPAYPIVQAGLAGAFSAVQIQKILAVKPQKGGGGSSGGGGGSQPAAPSFNLVEGTGTNQIAESIQGGQEPIKAFVVSAEVTSGQSLDRNIKENASI